jgi:anti-sigma-K factor RskA
MRKQTWRIVAAVCAVGGVAGTVTGVAASQQADAPPVVVHRPDNTGQAVVDELIRTIEEGRYDSLPPEDRQAPQMPGIPERP